MANESLVPHTVVAAMRLAGHQRSSTTVHNGGTAEAFVTVAIGRSVIYMHSSATTERFGTIWREAQLDALRLPLRRPLVRGPGAELPDIAEPSVVVHAAGRPAATVRLAQLPSAPMPSHLSIHIGDLGFLIYDQRAFASCAEVFLRAAAAGREQLSAADLRLTRLYPVVRAEPTLAGQDAERAAQSLLAHPAAARLVELEGRLEAIEGPLAELRTAVTTTRAQLDENSARREGDAPPAHRGTPRLPPAEPQHPATRAAASLRPPSATGQRGSAADDGRGDRPPTRPAAARLWLNKPQDPSARRPR